MEVQLENADGLVRQMRVRIPAEQVSKAVDARLRSIAARAKLPGFRPGKAPMKLIQSQYGRQARLDVVTDLVSDSYPEAVLKAGVNPAGAPSFEVTAETPGAELEYTASFEVYPEITLAELDNLSVERPQVEVTDADIDRLIETLRHSARSLEPVQRPATRGDVCVVDFRGRLDGAAFEGGTADDAELEIGSGGFLPGLENGLVGHAAGETFTVDASFPESYGAPDLAGKTARFEVTLKSVREPRLPEIDERFLKLHGVEEDGGVEALRAKCRAALEKERDAAIHARIKVQVLDGLLARHEVPVPQASITQAVVRLRREAAVRFNAGSLSDEQLEKMLPDDIFREEAKRRAALGLLVGEVIRRKEIKLEPARVERAIDELAADYAQPELVKQLYQSRPDLMQNVRALALEDQVVEYLLEQAQVRDQPMSLDQLLSRQPRGD